MSIVRNLRRFGLSLLVAGVSSGPIREREAWAVEGPSTRLQHSPIAAAPRNQPLTAAAVRSEAPPPAEPLLTNLQRPDLASRFRQLTKLKRDDYAATHKLEAGKGTITSPSSGAQMYQGNHGETGQPERLMRMGKEYRIYSGPHGEMQTMPGGMHMYSFMEESSGRRIDILSDLLARPGHERAMTHLDQERLRDVLERAYSRRSAGVTPREETIGSQWEAEARENEVVEQAIAQGGVLFVLRSEGMGQTAGPSVSLRRVLYIPDPKHPEDLRYVEVRSPPIAKGYITIEHGRMIGNDLIADSSQRLVWAAQGDL